MTDDTSKTLAMKDKCYVKMHCDYTKHLKVGMKFTDCDCLITSIHENEISVELCNPHSKSVKEGTIKHIEPMPQPAYPSMEIAERLIKE